MLYYTGFPCMQHSYRLQAAQQYVRAFTTESHPLYNERHHHEDITVTLKRTTPWTPAARSTVEEVVPVGNITSDPRVLYNDKPSVVDAVGDRTWRETDGAINNAEVSQYLQSIDANIVFATDGSLHDSITAWGDAVWGNNSKAFEWYAGWHGSTTSFRAESQAYEDALIWMAVKEDSLSLVGRLQCGHVKANTVTPRSITEKLISQAMLALGTMRLQTSWQEQQNLSIPFNCTQMTSRTGCMQRLERPLPLEEPGGF